jgi:hypothetical protein
MNSQINKRHTIENIKKYINKLLYWIELNGFEGWDPYDIWDNAFGLWAVSQKNIFSKITGHILSKLNDYYPLTIRKIFNIKPKINAKAMGLFASSFLMLDKIGIKTYKIKEENVYEYCFNWLNQNRITKFGGCGWGYPFDWQSRILIPRNTPTVVNSAIIGNAYWIKYKLYNDRNALIRCKEICEFIIKGLNPRIKQVDKAFCFSYTPLDNFQVHNANLFGAEFLIRIGNECHIKSWIDIGLSAANYSLLEIRDDGTLNYWSNEQSNGIITQDTYHSGFEIRALDNIANTLNNIEYRKAANKYFHTWLKDYFSGDGKPNFLRGDNSILEVHSCAEAIICITQLAESIQMDEKEFLAHIMKIIDVSARFLWKDISDSSGYFCSRNKKVYFWDQKTNIPMIRWGIAWMFYALVNALYFLCKDDI